MKSLLQVIALTVALGVASAQAQDLPISVQGSVRLPGPTIPADGNYDIAMIIYDAAVGGNLLHVELDPAVQLIQGVYSTTLGDNTPFAAGLFEGAPGLWLEIAVDTNLDGIDANDVFGPRMKLVSSPFASWALSAGGLSPGDVTIDGCILITKSIDAPSFAAFQGVHEINTFTTNTGAQDVRALDIFTDSAGQTTGRTYGVISGVRVDGSGGDGFLANILFDGSALAAYNPTSSPLLVGTNSVAGLHPSTPGTSAITAIGGVFAATAIQQGLNIGTGSVASGGAAANIGTVSLANVSAIALPGVISLFPSGFSAGLVSGNVLGLPTGDMFPSQNPHYSMLSAGRNRFIYTIDAPDATNQRGSSFEQVVTGAGSQSVQGVQSRVEASGYTGGNTATGEGSVDAFFARAYTDGLLASGVYAESTYAGANTDVSDPTTLPIIRGTDGRSSLTGAADPATIAYAGVGASGVSVSPQQGMNVGTAGIARDGALSNVGALGAANVADSEVAVVMSLFAPGFGAGGVFINNDTVSADQWAIFASGNVGISGGRLTIAPSTASIVGGVWTTSGPSNIYGVTGSGTTDSIPAGLDGTEITLIFFGAVTLQVGNGLVLAGGVDFSSTPNDVLKLIAVGGGWHEVSRSLN